MRLIGWVLFKSPLNIGFLEIGYILPSFHWFGIRCWVKHWLKRLVITCKKVRLAYLAFYN